MEKARERIEAIKTGVDLVALIRSRNIPLLCPFHDDHDPSLSVNPITNLWQCFGCGVAGDVIRFVELYDKVDFKEAVKILSDNGFKAAQRANPSEGPQQKEPAPLTVKERKLPGL